MSGEFYQFLVDDTEDVVTETDQQLREAHIKRRLEAAMKNETVVRMIDRYREYGVEA